MNPDELAGVVDLFGALSHPELEEALEEYAFRQDVEVPAGLVEEALEQYVLVEYGGRPLVAVGPAAFPTLPEGAADLPHIVNTPERSPDRETLAAAVEQRYRADVDGAVEAGSDPELRRLLDVSYDLEAWGPIDVGDARERLDAALDV